MSLSEIFSDDIFITFIFTAPWFWIVPVNYKCPLPVLAMLEY